MNDVKNISIWIIVMVMSLPICLDIARLKKPHPLKGENTELPFPQLKLESLILGSYTDSLNDYLKTNFTLRGMAIRTRNQIDYTIFNQTHARSVLVGKNGYLFEENYIKAALGTDNFDESKFEEKISLLEELYDSTGVPIFVALAPGKASYFIDFIPDKYTANDSVKADRTYLKWKQRVDESEKLHLVDLKFQLDPLEDLFPKNGIHWSEWAQVEAFNILNDALDLYLPNNKHPLNFVVDSVYRSDQMEGTDEDIESGLNLWQDIPDLETTYYKVSWEVNDSTSKPRVLLIGDSYAWGVVNRGVLKHSYDDGEFWYYNQVVHGPKHLGTADFGKTPFEVHEIKSKSDFHKTLKQFNAIVLLSTDANLHKFPFGFGNIDE
tara:strand:- start:1759 stop:2895 length:1137 start_codon:yes stop_codon:yes gene_type:complete